MTEAAGPRPRGRPVDSSIEAKAMKAAVEVYAQVGWANFTMDAVAKRAKIGKSSLYRRWSTRRELFRSAWAVENILFIEAPDTGDIRRDLITAGLNVVERLSQGIGVAELRFLLDLQFYADEIDDNLDDTRAQNRRVARGRVSAAIVQGQLPHGTPATAVFDALRGSLIHSFLLAPPSGKAIWKERSPNLVAVVVDTLLAGFRAQVNIGDYSY